MISNHDAFLEAVISGDVGMIKALAAREPELLNKDYSLQEGTYKRTPQPISIVAARCLQPGSLSALAELGHCFKPENYFGSPVNHWPTLRSALRAGVRHAESGNLHQRAYDTVRVLLECTDPYVCYEPPEQRNTRRMVLAEAFTFDAVTKAPWLAQAALDYGVDQRRVNGVNSLPLAKDALIELFSVDEATQAMITEEKGVAYLDTLARMGVNFTDALEIPTGRELINHVRNKIARMKGSGSAVMIKSDQCKPHLDHIFGAVREKAQDTLAQWFAQGVPSLTQVVGKEGHLTPEAQRVFSMGGLKEFLYHKAWYPQNRAEMYHAVHAAMTPYWRGVLEQTVDAVELLREEGKPADQVRVGELALALKSASRDA